MSPRLIPGLQLSASSCQNVPGPRTNQRRACVGRKVRTQTSSPVRSQPTHTRPPSLIFIHRQQSAKTPQEQGMRPGLKLHHAFLLAAVVRAGHRGSSQPTALRLASDSAPRVMPRHLKLSPAPSLDRVAPL
ncbi:unnamed protein product [Pleuronectes platessa]|uniref:Uncharacterized protein n=1 Tax=Pleuronectes platessa TaxID=8262 RepID=A0A9N7YD96_PLEPL|nr:unnamed protein product [Pleuronectes platessa]